MNLMHPRTLLAASLLAASALTASAATYSVSGTITSSQVAFYTVGSSFQIQFNYDPAQAGGDFNGGADVGGYSGAVSDLIFRYGGTNFTGTVPYVGISNQPVSTGGGDSFVPIINTLSGSAGTGLKSGYSEFRLSGGENRWTSDALPTDLLSPAWQSGTLQLVYDGPYDDFSPPWDQPTLNVNGTLNTSSLRAGTLAETNTSAVPEPSSQLALIALGSAGILTRRRTKRKA